LGFLTIPFFVIRFDLCLYFFFIDFTAMHTAGRETMYMHEKPRTMMVLGYNDRGFLDHWEVQRSVPKALSRAKEYCPSFMIYI